MACTFDKPQISVLHDYSRKGAHSPKIIETSCLGDVQKEVVNPAPTKRFRDLGLMVIWSCIGEGGRVRENCDPYWCNLYPDILR